MIGCIFLGEGVPITLCAPFSNSDKDSSNYTFSKQHLPWEGHIFSLHTKVLYWLAIQTNRSSPNSSAYFSPPGTDAWYHPINHTHPTSPKLTHPASLVHSLILENPAQTWPHIFPIKGRHSHLFLIWLLPKPVPETRIGCRWFIWRTILGSINEGRWTWNSKMRKASKIC